jgi:secreted protein with Ig-like and vWFA domain
VRIEELINYFPYRYAPPVGGAETPFAANLAVASAPWAPAHRLVRIGVKGRELSAETRPAANLVFLVDVSGSMSAENKLPLVKSSLRLLLGRLRSDDRVAIVTYAGASGLALPSTPAERGGEILDALDRLESGGSTNGGMGIHLAYDIAKANFRPDGLNRVILCTDGDFNVGVTGREELLALVKEKATSRVFLTVLGFGMGNLKDGTLEMLADKGNGAYGYIDSAREARKVFVEQVEGTLATIAKDVKIQVEFNPARVASYRLIGYENRALAKEDFNNDKVDAGEIGAGHTVTALYEIVPVRTPGEDGEEVPAVDALKYGAPATPKPAAARVAPPLGAISDELLTVKIRYKAPEGDVSRKLEFPLVDRGAAFAAADGEFKFAAAVAAWGMLLRESDHVGATTGADVLRWAEEGLANDPQGHRAEFVELVRRAGELGQGGGGLRQGRRVTEVLPCLNLGAGAEGGAGAGGAEGGGCARIDPMGADGTQLRQGDGGGLELGGVHGVAGRVGGAGDELVEPNLVGEVAVFRRAERAFELVEGFFQGGEVGAEADPAVIFPGHGRGFRGDVKAFEEQVGRGRAAGGQGLDARGRHVEIQPALGGVEGDGDDAVAVAGQAGLGGVGPVLHGGDHGAEKTEQAFATGAGRRVGAGPGGRTGIEAVPAFLDALLVAADHARPEPARRVVPGLDQVEAEGRSARQGGVEEVEGKVAAHAAVGKPATLGRLVFGRAGGRVWKKAAVDGVERHGLEQHGETQAHAGGHHDGEVGGGGPGMVAERGEALAAGDAGGFAIVRAGAGEHPGDHVGREETGEFVGPKIETMVFPEIGVGAKRQAVGSAVGKAGRHHLEVDPARGGFGVGLGGIPEMGEEQRHGAGRQAGGFVEDFGEPVGEAFAGFGLGATAAKAVAIGGEFAHQIEEQGGGGGQARADTGDEQTEGEGEAAPEERPVGEGERGEPAKDETGGEAEQEGQRVMA